jgi:hypothetical protein
MCVRTTLIIPDVLYADVKLTAARQKRTVTALVEEALRDLLRHHSEADQNPEPFHLEPFGGQGLRPGVDLTDSSALADLMDQL